MESKVNYAVVGVFVLLFGAAFGGGVLWLSSGKYYRKTYDTYLVYMRESVSGLSVNAPVKYRGVELGWVRAISLAPQNNELVQLRLDIERGTPIKQDSVAVLRVQGLTGIAFVEISGGSRGSPLLTAREGEPYPVIASGPSLLVRLDAAVSGLITSVGQTADSLNAALNEENRKALAHLLADLEKLTGTLAARAGAIDATLANMARATEQAARVSAELPDLIAKLNRGADALDRMAHDVSAAAAGAGRTLESASTEVRRLGAETAPEVNALVAEMREVTATLRRVARELEAQPSLLVTGRPAPRPGPGEGGGSR